MILPIYLYGSNVLSKKCKNVDFKSKELNSVIKNMFKTLKKSNGIGLAAPQVGESIRLFIIDTSPFLDMDDEKNQDLQVSRVKEVFINYLDQLNHRKTPERFAILFEIYNNYINNMKIRKMIDYDDYATYCISYLRKNKFDNLIDNIFSTIKKYTKF